VTTAVGISNLVLGLVYCQYGTMTLIEMRRHWSRMGFSHFGAAWIAMAFTCGPHHVVHGLHLLTTGASAGPLDLAVVLIGFPAGVTWFLLRVEAFRGGAGDRFIKGTPLLVLALPTLAGVYLGALLAILVSTGKFAGEHVAAVAPNLLLVFIYATIGYYLGRTQLANRRPLGGWSVSGLALTVIFPTCAVMHAIYAYYSLSGRYGPAVHTTVVDWVAVPAGMYFLWVVQALYRGTFRDWNGTPRLAHGSQQASASITTVAIVVALALGALAGSHALPARAAGPGAVRIETHPFYCRLL